MKIKNLICLLMVLLACKWDKSVGLQQWEEQLEIRYGTSFGECICHCSKMLTLCDGIGTMTISGGAKTNCPEIHQTLILSGKEWVELAQSIDWQALEALPDVIGCPDCTDGGAEWVEVVSRSRSTSTGTSRSKRVTFEYGDIIESIDALLSRLREIASAP